MTTLEYLEEQINHCMEQMEIYASNHDKELTSYYQGRCEAYMHAKDLLLLDKKYHKVSY